MEEEQTEINNKFTLNNISLQKIVSNKKLLFAGIVILVFMATFITMLFISLAKRQNPTTTTSKNAEQSAVKKESPTISLIPSVITLKVGQNDYSTTVMVDSQDIEVQGVAIEIEYDPSVLSSVRIVPSSDADLNIGGAIKIESLASNPTAGKASLVIRKNPSQKLSPQKISGRVAMIYFTINKNATLPTSINLTNTSEFITVDAQPTNPRKFGLTFK